MHQSRSSLSLALAAVLLMAAAAPPAASALSVIQTAMAYFEKAKTCYDNNMSKGVSEIMQGKSPLEFVEDPGKDVKCTFECLVAANPVFSDPKSILPFINTAAEYASKILDDNIVKEWKSGVEECANKDYTQEGECSGSWNLMVCYGKNEIKTVMNLVKDFQSVQSVMSSFAAKAVASYMG